MRRRRRSVQAGMTMLEVVIATTLLAAVLGSAVTLLNTSNELSRSVSDERAAAMRVDRALASIAGEFRKGSLATAAHLDDTPFADGDADTGFQINPVEGWDGSAIRGTQVRYEYVVDAGSAEGELVRREGAVETLLARGITAFKVSRAGNTFTFVVEAASGHMDDSRRKATGIVRVMARNP